MGVRAGVALITNIPARRAALGFGGAVPGLNVPLCPDIAPSIVSPSHRPPETRPADPLLHLPSTGSRSRYLVCNHGVYMMLAAIPNLYNQNPKAFAVFELPQLNLANTPPHMADHFLKRMKTISPEVLCVIIPACLKGRRSSSAPPALHTHVRACTHVTQAFAQHFASRVPTSAPVIHSSDWFGVRLAFYWLHPPGLRGEVPPARPLSKLCSNSPKC